MLGIFIIGNENKTENILTYYTHMLSNTDSSGTSVPETNTELFEKL